MSPCLPTPRSVELSHHVEAFEAALVYDPDADLGSFLPDEDDPLYPQVLAELVRVDLEHAWSRGKLRRLADYRRFPAVFANLAILQAAAFEEYRLRRRAGQCVDDGHGDLAHAA